MNKTSQNTDSKKIGAKATSRKIGPVTSVRGSTKRKYSTRYNAAMGILSDITKSEIASINAVTERILNRSK